MLNCAAVPAKVYTSVAERQTLHVCNHKGQSGITTPRLMKRFYININCYAETNPIFSIKNRRSKCRPASASRILQS